MNPNAIEFVPFTKYDHAEQRKKQRSKESENIQQQIYELKHLLATENQELVAFHSRLQNHYAVLSYQINAEQNQNEHLTVSLRQRYQAESAKYYAKYTKFNDLTSELVTLQQTLHRILMHPDSQSQSNAKNEYQQQQQRDLNAMDGIKKNQTPTPHHALQAIMESDEDDKEWIDYDEYASSEYATDSDLSFTAYL